MIYTALSTLFRHWFRHPGQLATLLLGLALATALWSGVQAINAEARSAYDDAASSLGRDQLDQLIRPDRGPVPMADFIALRRAGYLVSPVISGELRSNGARLRLLGIDPLTAPAEAQAPAPTGEDGADFADLFGTPGVLFVQPDTANGPLPGDLPSLVLSDTVPPGAAITDIATAARLLGQSDPSYLLLAPTQPIGLLPLAEITDLLLEPRQSGADIARLTDSFHLNLTAFGLLSFAVGLFIVHGAVGLAFEQRRATFRTLRALGLPMRSLLTALGFEMASLALVAGIVGLVLGYLIAATLMPGVAGTLRGLYGAEIAGSLRFDPVWALSALAMTGLGAAVATAQAMIRTAMMPLLAPAHPRAWAHASGRAMQAQALAAAVFGGLAIGLVLFADGLLSGFATLAALLLAAALLLPMILTLVLGGASQLATSETLEWLFADTRQQLPSLSLALMALLLALAANIGVSTMVGSFRTTFLGWLDQRLASELYVNVTSEEEALRLEAFLLPRAQAVLPIISAETRLFDRPAEVFGVVDHATYRDHWPLLSATPDVWQTLAAGNGILINEQLARRQGLSLGDLVRVTPDLTLPMLGVYSDYGNPNGQAIVSFRLFRDLFPDAPLTRFALRVAPTDTAALATTLRTEFGLPTDAVVNQSQIKRFSIDVFDQTFRITGALNVLTLGVAGIALLTSLLTLANMRLPQVAPVWAIGVTRSRLARFELMRSVILALLTFCLAVPVGLGLAWILLAVVNVEAFGWRLPMQVFPQDWLTLLGLACLAAALAAAWPAWRLANLPPTTLLKVFSNDR